MQSFVVIDIETRIQKNLINATRYPRAGLTDDEAYDRYRVELQAERGSDFFPVLYHVPISIAVGSVNERYELVSVITLGQEAIDAKADESSITRQMVQQFWHLVAEGHTLVTYNGRSFDLPVLELAALRYGFPCPRYWVSGTQGARYRYSENHHLDLADVLCNSGAVPKMRLNDLLIRLGFEGKGDVEGSKVQALYEAGEMAAIHEYCQHDVIATWKLWTRLEVVRGKLSPKDYAGLLVSDRREHA